MKPIYWGIVETKKNNIFLMRILQLNILNQRKTRKIRIFPTEKGEKLYQNWGTRHVGKDELKNFLTNYEQLGRLQICQRICLNHYKDSLFL